MEISISSVFKLMPRQYDRMRKHPNQDLWKEVKKSLEKYLKEELSNPEYILLCHCQFLESNLKLIKSYVEHPEILKEGFRTTRFVKFPGFDSNFIFVHGQYKFMVVLMEQFVFKDHPFPKVPLDKYGNPLPPATKEELESVIPGLAKMNCGTQTTSAAASLVKLANGSKKGN